MLTYGDCFSGMSCPAYALKQLGIEFEYKFACDNNKTCQRFLETEHSPDVIYDDARTVQELPKVDLFVAGFPCQPFSGANSMIKTEEHKSVDLFDEAFRWINMCDPEIFILENVKGLTFKSNKKYFDNVLTKLKSLDNYHFEYKLMDSKDYGSTMMRNRIWFIGKKTGTVVWPVKKTTDTTIWNVLDTELPVYPFNSTSKVYPEMIEKYGDGLYIDNGQTLGSFWKFYGTEEKLARCVTTKNCPALYRISGNMILRREFTDQELKQLFGLKTDINGNYGRQLPKLLGNGMDIGILEQILEMYFTEY